MAQLHRRQILGGVAVAGLVAVAGFTLFDGQNLFYSALREDFAGDTLDAVEAHRMAAAGEIVLVDIRRPDEWTNTGSAAGALRLDMRRDDFIDVLAAAMEGDATAPVALICARGVRSARLGNLLRDAGFTRVIDVPEGMLGSAAGPGWIARGLPVERTE